MTLGRGRKGTAELHAKAMKPRFWYNVRNYVRRKCFRAA